MLIDQLASNMVISLRKLMLWAVLGFWKEVCYTTMNCYSSFSGSALGLVDSLPNGWV